MKDEQTIILVESINCNPNLDACTKLDLIKKTMSDCREKQVGAILIEAIGKQEKKIKKKQKAEYKKREKASLESEIPVKRGRGRPKKIKVLDLVEVVEIPGHPFFLATQFHPEFTSNTRDGHPLFTRFIQATRIHNEGTMPKAAEA